MTDAEKDTEVTELPEGHYITFIKSRELLVKEMTGGQQMIVSMLFTDFKRDRGDVVSGYAKIGKILESIVVRPEDREWLEDGLLDGSLTAEDIGMIFNVAAAPRTPKKAVKKTIIRRGR